VAFSAKLKIIEIAS